MASVHWHGMGVQAGDASMQKLAALFDCNFDAFARYSWRTAQDVPLMGLDRALTVYLVHPSQWSMNNDSPGGLPILMYHNIADEPERRPAYYKINTSPAVFEKQMHFLQQHGYQTILASEAAQLLSKRQWPRTPTVAISFDDGYRNFYTRAFELLQEYGFRATLFLPTNYIQPARIISRRRTHDMENDQITCTIWR